MIGQKYNKKLIDNWVFNKSIPRFILIFGNPGSGKFTLAQYIANKINANICVMDNAKDDIKETILSAYTITSPTCYIFKDIDNMSDAAKNALLKITEEPPNKVYFIMTAMEMSNILPTIISRASVLNMNSYSMDELRELTSDETLLKYCTLPSEIMYWSENDIKPFIAFCNDCYDTIMNGTGVKSLQIYKQLKLKQDDDGYDPIQFISILHKLIAPNLINYMETWEYLSFCMHVNAYKHDLCNKSYKKECIIDKYLLWLRDIVSDIPGDKK